MKRIILTLIILLCFASVCSAAINVDVDAALSEVIVNKYPMTDSDGVIDAGVTYNEAGLSLIWHFALTDGTYTQTAVTPTDTAGDYDWVIQGNGTCTIEIPATGGGTINNNAEGTGYFTGDTTATLPFVGPEYIFRKVGINNWFIDVGEISVATVYTDPITRGDIETDAQTGANAALVALDLDHLLKVTTGVAAGGDLSGFIHNLSILGHMLSNANVSDYGSDDDSLVVLSDAIAALPAATTDDWETQSQIDPTGFWVNLKEINAIVTKLEMLMDASTTINADDDLTSVVKDKSVLSHLMTPAANTSTYNASEDSLEALGTHADAVTTIGLSR